MIHQAMAWLWWRCRTLSGHPDRGVATLWHGVYVTLCRERSMWQSVGSSILR